MCFDTMNLLQSIEKQQGKQSMAHNNTVFAQLIKLAPRHEFESLQKQHHQGRQLRKMMRWSQFIALGFAQLSGRCSLRDIVCNVAAQREKLYHLGAGRVTRSYLAESMRNNPLLWMKLCLTRCYLVARD